MKKLSLVTLSIILLAGLSSIPAHAQNSGDLKIGFVNPQAVLAKMPEMRSIQQRLTNKAEQLQQQLATQEQAYLDEVAAYEQKQGVLSDAAKQKEEERLTQLQNDLLQAQRNAEQELETRRQELLGPLFSQIGTAIDTVAERMGLSYVLNTTTSSGDLIILYASQEYQSQYDITEEVMQELGIF